MTMFLSPRTGGVRGARHAYRMMRMASYSARRSNQDDPEELPRITCPKNLLEKLEKEKKKRTEGRKKSQARGPMLISCKRKEYNFHSGERFDGFNVHEMVTGGWKNRKRVGDHFTLMAHSSNPSISDDTSRTSFEELGISESLCAGLRELGFTTPTEIQSRAIPILLRGDNAICAAETGSGKTLAYLLPTIEWILQQKQFQNEQETVSNIGNPNTVIVTPNRELNHQIMGVATSLTQFADFVPHCIQGGENPLIKYRKLRQTPMDVLVATPGGLRKQLKARNIHAKNLQHFVIDESDTLLDDSFISEMEEIFQMLQLDPAEGVDDRLPILGGTQIVLVSATMPRTVEEALGHILPVDSVQKITTRSLHHLQPHVPQKFIRINPDSKPVQLIQLVKASVEKNLPTLVFVKNNKTCYFVAKLLKENNIDCLQMNGDLSKSERSGIFKKFKEGYSDILVATDIASRGLDTTNVHHVINYDFPSFMSDYIHRVGRVGRVGTKHTGHVTSFVSHAWDVDLMWKIEIAARKQKQLDAVDANIKRKFIKLHPEDSEMELNIM